MGGSNDLALQHAPWQVEIVAEAGEPVTFVRRQGVPGWCQSISSIC
jgi:hypothetical protein